MARLLTLPLLTTLLTVALSGCAVQEPVAFQPAAALGPVTVKAAMPDRPLRIHGGNGPFDDRLLVEAFQASGLFREVTLVPDHYPAMEEYFLKRDCERQAGQVKVAGHLATWLLSAFILPASESRVVHRCHLTLSLNDEVLFKDTQVFHETTYGYGLLLAVHYGRSGKAAAYNPRAVATDTVHRVLGGMQ